VLVLNAVVEKQDKSIAYIFMLHSSVEGKKQLRRPRHRREDNIRMGLREIGWEGVGWTHLAQEGDQWWVLVNTVMNLRIP